jgi:hypothetical protein
MSDEWNNGWKAGYEAGYEAGCSDMNKKKEIKVTKIHDPGQVDDTYEQAYGASLFRSMKQSHKSDL